MTRLVLLPYGFHENVRGLPTEVIDGDFVYRGRHALRYEKSSCRWYGGAARKLLLTYDPILAFYRQPVEASKKDA